MEKFELASSLIALRKDLEALRSEGTDKAVKFLIEDVTIDLTLVAAKSADASAGVKWWIVSAEAGGEVSEQTTQKLSVKLKVVDRKGKGPVPMGDDG